MMDVAAITDVTVDECSEAPWIDGEDEANRGHTKAAAATSEPNDVLLFLLGNAPPKAVKASVDDHPGGNSHFSKDEHGDTEQDDSDGERVTAGGEDTAQWVLTHAELKPVNENSDVHKVGASACQSFNTAQTPAITVRKKPSELLNSKARALAAASVASNSPTRSVRKQKGSDAKQASHVAKRVRFLLAGSLTCVDDAVALTDDVSQIAMSRPASTSVRGNKISPTKSKPTKPTAQITASPKAPVDVANPPAFEAVSTQETAFACSVAVALVCYLIAVVYRVFHPIDVPLPDITTLQSGIDVSNVSVSIDKPVNQSSWFNGPLDIAWSLRDFPSIAVEKYGSEVFQYRVVINERRTAAEVGFWSFDDLRTLANSTVINKAFSYRVLPHQWDPVQEQQTVRIEVKFPIPGSVDNMVQLNSHIEVQLKRPTTRQLEITAPANGAVFSTGTSVLIEYVAQQISNLEIEVDGTHRFPKSRVAEGNMLLRGLGVGKHTVRLVDTTPGANIEGGDRLENMISFEIVDG